MNRELIDILEVPLGGRVILLEDYAAKGPKDVYTIVELKDYTLKNSVICLCMEKGILKQFKTNGFQEVIWYKSDEEMKKDKKK